MCVCVCALYRLSQKQDARIIIAGFYEDKAFSVFCEVSRHDT